MDEPNLTRKVLIQIVWRTILENREMVYTGHSSVDHLLRTYYDLMNDGIVGEAFKYSFLREVAKAGDREMIDFILAKGWDVIEDEDASEDEYVDCLLYTSPSPRDRS